MKYIKQKTGGVAAHAVVYARGTNERPSALPVNCPRLAREARGLARGLVRPLPVERPLPVISQGSAAFLGDTRAA